MIKQRGFPANKVAVPMLPTHDEFIAFITRPMYVWRMANSILYYKRMGQKLNPAMIKSAETRARKAQEEIDNLILKRASAIKRERAR